MLSTASRLTAEYSCRGRPATTCPEPDLAAYHDYPWQLPRRHRRWQDISPILVAEVASDDLAKDFDRNVGLYEQVPSIQEYWLIHGGDNDSQFLFRVYRRRGRSGKSRSTSVSAKPTRPAYCPGSPCSSTPTPDGPLSAQGIRA